MVRSVSNILLAQVLFIHQRHPSTKIVKQLDYISKWEIHIDHFNINEPIGANSVEEKNARSDDELEVF